jgi:hypothetical protein
MSNKILASTAGKFIPQQAEQVSKAKQPCSKQESINFTPFSSPSQPKFFFTIDSIVNNSHVTSTWLR